MALETCHASVALSIERVKVGFNLSFALI